MRTYRTLSFDGDVERSTLTRIKPSLQIAFPALLERGSHVEKRGVFGRHLDGVCARPDQRFEAEWIHAAWEEAVTLEATLEAQSDRAFWDRELAPKGKAARQAAEAAVAEREASGAVGLIAPGTDMAAALSEIRESQLRDVREAIKLLAEAKQVVGPIPDPEDED